MRTILFTCILLLVFNKNVIAQFGTIDSSFGEHGKVVTSLGDAYATSVIVQKNGKIVVGGTYFDFYSGDKEFFYLTRFHPNGLLDKSFGDKGSAIPKWSDQYATVRDISLQSDGKILASGNFAYITGTPWQYFSSVTTRYTANGVGDSTFGYGGMARNSWQGYAEKIL